MHHVPDGTSVTAMLDRNACCSDSGLDGSRSNRSHHKRNSPGQEERPHTASTVIENLNKARLFGTTENQSFSAATC